MGDKGHGDKGDKGQGNKGDKGDKGQGKSAGKTTSQQYMRLGWGFDVVFNPRFTIMGVLLWYFKSCGVLL